MVATIVVIIWSVSSRSPWTIFFLCTTANGVAQGICVVLASREPVSKLLPKLAVITAKTFVANVLVIMTMLISLFIEFADQGFEDSETFGSGV